MDLIEIKSDKGLIQYGDKSLTVAGFFTDKTTHVDELVALITTQATSVVPDVTSQKGRDEIISLAFRVTRAKTQLDGLGKDLTAAQKAATAIVDRKRKKIRDDLEALAIEIRQPVTDLERVEAARVQKIKGDIDTATANVTQLPYGLGPAAALDILKARRAVAAALSPSAMAEFAGEASAAKVAALSALDLAIAETEKRVADEAELLRLKTEAENNRLAKEKEDREAREKAGPVVAVETDDQDGAPLREVFVVPPGEDLALKHYGVPAASLPRAALTAGELIRKIESYGFECEDGHLRTCPEWIALKMMVAP